MQMLGYMIFPFQELMHSSRKNHKLIDFILKIINLNLVHLSKYKLQSNWTKHLNTISRQEEQYSPLTFNKTKDFSVSWGLQPQVNPLIRTTCIKSKCNSFKNKELPRRIKNQMNFYCTKIMRSCLKLISLMKWQCWEGTVTCFMNS